MWATATQFAQSVAHAPNSQKTIAAIYRVSLMGMGENEITRGPQVFVFPLARVPFWVPMFDPHPDLP